MLWDEYVEDLTEGLRNRQRAREVRREVRDHLQCLYEQLVSEGLTSEAAQSRAMDILGPMELLARRFVDLERPYRPLWPAAVTVIGLLWGSGTGVRSRPWCTASGAIAQSPRASTGGN